MSRFKINITSTIAQRFKMNNVFFLKYLSHSYINSDGIEVDDSKWVAVDSDLYISIETWGIDLEERNHHLCIVELDSKEQHKDERGNIIEDEFEIIVHAASLQNENDLQQLFASYSYHMQRLEKDYACMELLWLLNAYDIETTTLKKALTDANKYTSQWVCNGLVDFGRCLSVRKQNQLKDVVATFGYTFHVYEPRVIQDAFSRLNISLRYSQSNKNVFEAVDLILSPENSFNADLVDDNMLLKLRRWLGNNESYGDYSKLVNLYALVDEPVRLAMLKRWFHDIRLGNTVFDPELLAQFRDNRFGNFVRFRHCIYTPGEPVVLTVPLLADNILTLYNTNGANFQSFDGVLDFAISHCDSSHPAIDFKMDRFLPICNGGTQRNVNFVGFVNYALIRKLDKSKLSPEFVLPIIRQLLDTYAQRKLYTACRWNKSVPLSAEQLQNCLKKRVRHTDEVISFNNPQHYRLECAVTCHYEDKWLIKQEKDGFDFSILFVDGVLSLGKTTEVDISMVSADKFISFLSLLPSRFKELGNDEFLVPAYRDRTLLLQLVEEFSTIERMRIYPNKFVYAGLSFDIFGILRRICEENGLTNEQYSLITSSSQQNEIKEKYAKEEAKEVYSRILKSLKTHYNLGLFNEDGNYFETTFDRSVLNEILRKYFFNVSKIDAANKDYLSFLTSKVLAKFKPYCSPSLEEVRNEILDIPYFWCRGNECFHNCLGNQTLTEIRNWRLYSLFHLIEIIGFPKLHSTEIGYEPSTEVIQFIAVTNKAMQKFRRLKCRVCGHLLFTDKSSGFNRNNYYACANLNCTEYLKPVYLSYCFKCKKGLIDSRDTVKCPNGWYICPACLSCCDDAQYERQAQRYVNTKRPIPQRVLNKLGKGHNDKGIHFCPKCGTQIERFQDEHGDFHLGCPHCREEFII